jgi:protein SCO1/2
MFKALVCLAVAMLALLGCAQPYELKGTAFAEPFARPEFELLSETGQPYRFGERDGKIALLFFGYTTCPDVCPTTMAEARAILEGLGEQAGQVEFLFVTVDPERDSADKLAAYTDAFHPAIVGLTGTPEQLAAVYDDFMVNAVRQEAPESALGYAISHTSRVYLVDQQGNLRLSYGYGTPREDILADVEHLLAHPERGDDEEI